MTPTSSHLPDTSAISELILQTRRLLRSTWVKTGLSLTVGLLLAVLVFATTVDLLLPLAWPWLRLIALLLVLGPAGWVFVQGVMWPLWRRLGPVQVARHIEAHIPGIHNRLVSCVDLAEAGGGTFPTCRASSGHVENVPPQGAKGPRISLPLYRLLVQETLEHIRDFRPRSLIDIRARNRLRLFSGGSIAALLVLALLFGSRLPTAVARILLPFADIPPASSVYYAVQPGSAKVLRGEDITFTAEIGRGEPEELVLELHGDKGSNTLRHPLVKQEGGLWKCTLNTSNIGTGFEHSFTYRIRGGGTWSKQYRVGILDRPTVINRFVRLYYPSYLGEAEPREGPPQMLDVSGPEGSMVEVVIDVDVPVAEANIQFLTLKARAGRPAAGACGAILGGDGTAQG